MATTEEREQLVNEAEALADRVERRLRQRIGEARERGTVAIEGVSSIEEGLEELSRRHGERGGVAALRQRIRGTFPPPLELVDHRERALSVREDAVRARAWVNNALEQDLARFFNDLSYVEGVIRDCTAELTALRGRLGASEDAMTKETSPSSLTPRDEAGESRRRSTRLRLRAEISLHSQSNFFRGFSENISDGGVFITTDRRVELGAEVDLAFRLPNGVEIRGRGVVRWVRAYNRDEPDMPAGVGVRFERLAGAAKEAVEAFIAGRDPLFFPI